MSTIKVDTIATRTGSGNITLSNNAVLSSDLTVDTDTLFADASADKVGINTTAMDASLEVNSATSKINTLTVKTAVGSGGVAGISFMAGQTTAGREKAAMFFKETNGGAHYTGDIVFAVASSSGNATQVAASDEVFRVRPTGIAIGGTGDANTFDDYEEGSFTPSFSNGISSATYSTQLGRYTKIGNMVLFSIFLRANGGTATSGHVTITGLPFTSNSSLSQEGAWFTYNGGFYNTSNATGAWLVLGNGNSMAFYRQTDGAALAGTSSGLATNLNADCRVAGFYRT